jgi:hypothetical protein
VTWFTGKTKLNLRRDHSRSALVPAAGALLRMTTVPEDIPCSPGDPVYRENKLNRRRDHSRFAPVPAAGASLRMTSSGRYSVFTRRPGLPGKQTQSAAGSQSLRSCSRRRRSAPDDDSSGRYSVFTRRPGLPGKQNSICGGITVAPLLFPPPALRSG